MRRRLCIAVVLVVAAAAAVAAAGRGGSHSPALAATCRAHAAAVHPGVPLPPGSVIVSAWRGLAGYRLYSGAVPGSLVEARDWFRSALPAHGYRLGAGDAERHEADTMFAGHGVVAHLRLRDLGGCAGSVTLELAVKTA